MRGGNTGNLKSCNLTGKKRVSGKFGDELFKLSADDFCLLVVIAVGAGNGLLVPASIGAVVACVLVFIIGVLIRRPLARVPENTLKFVVGVMLSAFGVFWTARVWVYHGPVRI